MKELQNILRNFAELRDQYPDIETAIEAVCISTSIDRERVVGLLSGAGLYILPDSEEEKDIKSFITSADKAKPTEKELSKAVAWNFCISEKEAERLVRLNYSEDVR